MKSIFKRCISLITVLLIVTGCFCVNVFADDEIPEDDGQMNLDVVFVLDASGSMLESYPNRVAIDAFNLFVDLCDDSCGVGYTVYSEKIKESTNITELTKQNLQTLKNNMSNIYYDPYGDTDIALGLTKAMNLHKENKNSDDKKKVIILLSDGNTHLLNGPRTVEDSQKEMDSTLKELKENGIPVYAIGLNYDGTLDKKETEKIASQTNGKAYETKTSDELPEIVSDIFADIYQINGSKKDIVDGNVQIHIKDSSVFYVNIIIRSRFTIEELNPVLTTPKGLESDLTGGDENIKVTTTGSYTMIKLIYPMSGRWKLHLDNATNENCIVTQLDFYSVFVKQSIDNSAVAGNGEVKTVELSLQPDNTFAGEFTTDKEGSYTVKTTAKSEKFNKESVPVVLTVSQYAPDDTGNADNSGDLTTAVSGTFGSELTRILIFVFVGVVLVVIAVLVVLKLKAKNDDRALSVVNAPPPPPRPKPVAPPVETVKPSPKETAPEYVDIPLVEHGSLESLIRKGPEDAFNGNADNYKTDAALEAIIKKGPDNTFGAGTVSTQSDSDNDTQEESYQSGFVLSDMMNHFDDDNS